MDQIIDEIKAGIAAADRGDVIPHNIVKVKWMKRKNLNATDAKTATGSKIKVQELG